MAAGSGHNALRRLTCSTAPAGRSGTSCAGGNSGPLLSAAEHQDLQVFRFIRRAPLVCRGWRPVPCLSRGMSIYGNLIRGRLARAIHKSPPEGRPRAVLAEEAQRRKRKGAPTNRVLKLTFNWATTLPRSVKPRALMGRFPRIANQLAAVWSEIPSVRLSLDSLLVDDRGHRQGFPQDVLRELLLLRLYHESLHPQGLSVWIGERRRSSALPK